MSNARQKANKYKNLSSNILTIYNKTNENISELESYYNNYTSKFPELTQAKMPNDDFQGAIERVNEEYKTLYDYFVGQLEDLNAAKTKADEQYNYYDSIANQKED